MYTAGSIIAYNGWATGWQTGTGQVDWSLPVLAEFARCIEGRGLLLNVQVSRLAGSANPYIKITGTLRQNAEMWQIAEAVEAAWDACVGWGYPSLTRHGVVIDYAAPGSSGNTGDQSTPSSGGSQGGLFDDIGKDLGISSSTVMAGLIVLAAVVLMRR